MRPEDAALLASVHAGGEWLRAVLCTLARRGLAFRLASPDRARAILDALQTSPLYRGGQFLFDLMEWEDFMLDGPPPAVVATTLDARALRQVARLLNSVKALLDGAGTQEDLPVRLVPLVVDDAELPPIEPGFYLYQDVVLGIFSSALPFFQGTPGTPDALPSNTDDGR